MWVRMWIIWIWIYEHEYMDACYLWIYEYTNRWIYENECMNTGIHEYVNTWIYEQTRT